MTEKYSGGIEGGDEYVICRLILMDNRLHIEHQIGESVLQGKAKRH